MKFSDLKNYWYIFTLIGVVFLLFFPIEKTYDKTFIIYHSLIDLGFADYGVFSALIVGLLGFLATIYTNDKNLKIMKLTSNSDEYLTLLTKLENIFLFYNIHISLNDNDLIITFMEIIELWKKYQNTFRLIYPKSYSAITQFFTEDITNTENLEKYERNAEMLILDVKLYILNKIATPEQSFKLKDSKEFTDNIKFNKLKAKKRY